MKEKRHLKNSFLSIAPIAFLFFIFISSRVQGSTREVIGIESWRSSLEGGATAMSIMTAVAARRRLIAEIQIPLLGQSSLKRILSRRTSIVGLEMRN